jgi:hypothetical protein
MATPEENNQLMVALETTPVTQPSKRRKKKSMVWEHFTIETVSPGCRRARVVTSASKVLHTVQVQK